MVVITPSLPHGDVRNPDYPPKTTKTLLQNVRVNK